MQITFNPLGNATEIVRGNDLFSGSNYNVYNTILVTFTEEIADISGVANNDNKGR